MNAATATIILALAGTAASAPPPKATPFACDRLALSPQQRARHFDELGPKLRALRTGVRELPDGYEFSFPGDADTLQTLTEWAVGERACCPFFDIALHMEREGGPLLLALTGREGTKAFIRADAPGWLAPAAPR